MQADFLRKVHAKLCGRKAKTFLEVGCARPPGTLTCMCVTAWNTSLGRGKPKMSGASWTLEALCLRAMLW